MTLHLLPYTVARHLAIGLQLGSAALVAWCIVQLGIVAGTSWSYANFGVIGWRELDGLVFLSALVIAVTFGSLALQGGLAGRSLRWRLGWGSVAAMIGAPGFALSHMLGSLLTEWLSSSSLLDDPSLVTLRYHLLGWLLAGFWAGLGTVAARSLATAAARRYVWARDGVEAPERRTWGERGLSIFTHLGGGLAAGGFASAVWHAPGHFALLGGDLYLPSAAASAVFGGICGMLFWGIPDTWYEGWLRVLTPTRFGLRVPISVDDTAAERFVGHYPRGLDLYLPEGEGLAELHCSVVVDKEGHYTVRGLSIMGTLVRRPLEVIDLRYDPARPAPLETTLRMEDRILLGEDEQSELEFVLLPKRTLK
ncbi:MAG: hypothetical protein AAGA48_40710 [Myxococcota bacterium]